MRWIVTLIVAIALTSISHAEESIPYTISTSGEANVYVVPDQAVLRVGIRHRETTLDAARSAVEGAAKRMLNAIRAAGLEEKHIQTEELQLTVLHDRSYSSERVQVNGFEATRNYTITLLDPSQLQAIIDLTLKNGANELHGFELRSTELRRYRDEARRLAIHAAKEKAIALAGELGCRVGPPRTIQESAYSYTPWHSRGNIFVNSQVSSQAGDDPASEADEIAPVGRIAVNAHISVTFDLYHDVPSIDPGNPQYKHSYFPTTKPADK